MKVPPAQPEFNRSKLMDRLGGDADLLADVIRIFLDDCPKRLAAIKNAVDLRDAELIRTTCFERAKREFEAEDSPH